MSAKDEPTRLSPSSLGLLRGPNPCRRCFWDAVRGDKDDHRPRGAFPSLPGGVDARLKDYADSWRGRTPPELVGHVQDGKLWGSIEEIKQLRAWNSSGAPTLLVETAHGQARLVGGHDDLLVHDDRRFSQLDCKSKGTRPKDSGAVYYQHQMDLLALLLDSNGKPSSGSAYLWYWYPVTTIRVASSLRIDGLTFESAVFRLDTDLTRARALVDEGMRVLSEALPALNPRCEYCRYRGAR